MDKPVVVGRLGAVYGIKGWLKVHSFTDDAESIFEYSPWLTQQNGEWREIRVSDGNVTTMGWSASWKVSTCEKTPKPWPEWTSLYSHKHFLSCRTESTTGAT